MIPRAAVLRRGQQALRPTFNGQSTRCLATAASGSYNYEAGEAEGVKLASRDLPGPTTHLAVIAKAGTRYQPLPGYSEGLEKFAYKNTVRRSALRIQRETELLGGELSSHHSRENLIISAKFLRADLPYFVELLGEVLTKTKFTSHELEEEVNPSIEAARAKLFRNTSEFALSSVHGVAFHRGLGNPLRPISGVPTKKYLNAGNLLAYSMAAYAKPNIAVVANGASFGDLNKWVGQFFADCPEEPLDGVPLSGDEPTQYYGGEERVAHASGSSMIIAFPGSSSFTGKAYKPELAVVAALLGGQTNIKWSPGFSLLSKATEAYPQAHINTVHRTYSDAGLITVSITGDGAQVSSASREVVKALKDTADGNISSDDIKKARATAKFQALESGQNIDTGLESTGAGLIQGGKPYQLDELAKSLDAVTEDQVRTAAKALLDGKASVSTVGDLFLLPFADEIGLKT